MRVLLIDVSGSFLDFALRCAEAGHEVRWFLGPLKDGTRSRIGDGFKEFKKISEWEPSMKWADIILLSDNVKYIPALEKYRKAGFPIFGPNIESTDWELDRDIGQRIFEQCGIETMKSVEFSNYDRAKEFVLKNMKRYVSKPNGDADKALSYVSKNPADMCFMLEYWKKHSKKKAPFILQEFVPGIEMAVGGWFGINGWSGFVLENFEHKKLMNGDVGVNTGEMGTAMKYCLWDDSKLAQEMLEPLTGHLYRTGYTGYIDVAVIIDEKGQAWPLEFTTRPGWPLFQIQQALHKGDPVEWMLDLVDGFDTFAPSLDVAIGVVIALPDFPYNTRKQSELFGYPVYNITDENREHIHPAEMAKAVAPNMKGATVKDEEMMVSSGSYLLVCSGTAKTISKAKDKAYKVVKSLEIPNSPIYRTDIGNRLEEQLPKLQRLGYATSWEW